jgi:hypothetical protein
LHRTWAPISWTAHGANKDAGFGQFGGPADGETIATLPVCTTTLFGKEGALQMLL